MNQKQENTKDVTNKAKTYTEDEIRQMSYWQLWGLRRKAGLMYYIILLSIYTFLTYAFCKVVYIFATKKFDNMSFNVDWWAVLLCLSVALIYWFFHELFYKNIFLKKHPDKAI